MDLGVCFLYGKLNTRYDLYAHFITYHTAGLYTVHGVMIAYSYCRKGPIPGAGYRFRQ